jgi:hypothetical protein
MNQALLDKLVFKVTGLLWKLRFYNYVPKNLPLESIPGQMRPFLILTLHSFKVRQRFPHV